MIFSFASDHSPGRFFSKAFSVRELLLLRLRTGISGWPFVIGYSEDEPPTNPGLVGICWCIPDPLALLLIHVSSGKGTSTDFDGWWCIELTWPVELERAGIALGEDGFSIEGGSMFVHELR